MKNSRQIKLAALAFVSFFAPQSAQAETERELGAHVHGIGQMNIAFTKNELEIDLVIPGMDIVGFEHQARTDADKTTYANALKTLKDTANMFAFPAAAQCTPKKKQGNKSPEYEAASDDVIVVGRPPAGDDHKGHKHGTHEHGSDKDHAHHSHEQAGHEQAGHKQAGHKQAGHDHKSHNQAKHDHKDHAGGEEHAAFWTTYQVSCKKPAELKTIDVLLFKQFKGAKVLKVQILGPKGQSSAKLTPSNSVLKF